MNQQLRVGRLNGGRGAPTVLAGTRAGTDELTGIIAVTAPRAVR